MSDPGRLGECKSKLATYATHASLNGRKTVARVWKRVKYNNDHLLCGAGKRWHRRPRAVPICL